MRNTYIFIFSLLVVAFLVPNTSEASATIRIYATNGDGQAGIGDTEGQTTWSAARAYTGTVSFTTQDTADSNTARSDLVLGNYRNYRGSLPFDTSVLPDNAIIESVVLKLYGYGSVGSQNGTKACVTTHTRSDVTNVVGSDYHLSNHGSTQLASSSVLANYQYTTFNLNSAGLNHINPAGYTTYSVRTHYDCDNTDPGSGGGTAIAVNWYSSESTGTSTDPYIEITYDVPPVTAKIYASNGDGQVGIGDTEAQTTWSSARAYTGTVSYTTQDTADSNTARSDKATGNYRLYRGTLPFDTSVLPDNAEFQSVALKLYGYGSAGSQNGAKACVTTHTRSDVTNVVGSDYYLSNHGSTQLASSSILANYQYTTFNLNSAGLDHVNPTGYSTYGVRTHYDCDNTDPGSGGGSVIAANWYSSEATGTSTDPLLEIIYKVY